MAAARSMLSVAAVASPASSHVACTLSSPPLVRSAATSSSSPSSLPSSLSIYLSIYLSLYPCALAALRPSRYFHRR